MVPQSEIPTILYRVQLGHSVVVVSAASADEAIAKARQQLSQEMPRFYDVIRKLDPSKFIVHAAA